jgi:hypothetical protein
MYHWKKIKKPISIKISEYFTLYGTIVQRFFQYYVNKYVKEGVSLSEAQIKKILRQDWEIMLQDKFVVWTDPWCKETANDIFESAYNDILLNIKKFDFFKFSRSEVTYTVILKKSQDELNGRMDFLVKYPDKVEILDGKGTAKVETNVDFEQLYFYALMYYLRHKKLPDKLGFWFFKLQQINYIDFTMEDILKFKDKLALVKKSIKEDITWAPKVKLSKHCLWCAYKFDCDAYLKKKEDRRKTGKGVTAPMIGKVVEFGA